MSIKPKQNHQQRVRRLSNREGANQNARERAEKKVGKVDPHLMIFGEILNGKGLGGTET